MGAGQSSSTGGAPPQQVKTSYYELLGVERQATDDQIKKAYRRKALELHPDRNHGNEESATQLFSEIQAAYEILSDPQERAWYDSHESSILRGDDPGGDEAPTYQNIRVTTADDLARMVSKFNSKVEYTDSPSGFFGYLRERFEQLAKEEEVAADWENVDVRQYPTFGHKNDTHDDVVKQFYSAWANFATVKTFAWKDIYRTSEAPDRRIRRIMEKENNAARQEAIREFNEAVRALVAFIRKRDPRFKPSTQSEEERQKTLRDLAAAQAARARKANEAAMNYVAPEWTKLPNPEDEEESEESEVEEEVFECVSCNKTFKSERQWEAHERSKKHQKAVQALQRKMKKDNANLDLSSSGVATPQKTEDEYELIDEEPEEDIQSLEDQPDEYTGDDKDIASNSNAEASDKEDPGIAQNAEPAADVTARSDIDASASGEDSDYASPEAIKDRLENTTLDDPADDAAEDDEAQPPGKKLGKAAQKRAKKAAAAASTEQSESSNKCASCNASFPSRTRLFQHIKDHGHAALKPASGGGGGKGRKAKGKR